MKKILMTLAAVAVATTMNAQTWIGGELGFSTSHTHSAGEGIYPSKTNITVKPEIGYNLNDKFAVAIALGYEYNSHVSVSGILGGANDVWDKNSSNTTTTDARNANTWSINPYVRYTAIKAGNFSVFVDGGIAYATTHIRKVGDNTNAFGVNITPGIAYAVSDKVSLVAHLGEGLYYAHSWNKGSETKLNNDGTVDKYGRASSYNNNFGFKLLNGVSFGAYYNF